MSNRLRDPAGIHSLQQQVMAGPRHASSRRASTNSMLPGRICKSRDIRGQRTHGPRHAEFSGAQTQAPHHRHSKYRPLRSTVTTGKVGATNTNERRKIRTKHILDSLASQLSAMDLSPPSPTVDSLLDKLDKMQVDTDAAKSDPPSSRPLHTLFTHPQPIPISSHIWLKITLLNTPFIPSTFQLQSISLLLTEAPTLRALQNELIRTIAETCRVRRRAIPLPDSWAFRVTTGGFGRTFWIGQPSREHSLDLLVDEGEPIYQAFAGECRALAEEERARLEGEMMSSPGTEERSFGGGGRGGGRRQRRQVNRIVQMVGQQEEPVVLARAWASCEVSFPDVEDVVEMELDDLPM